VSHQFPMRSVGRWLRVESGAVVDGLGYWSRGAGRPGAGEGLTSASGRADTVTSLGMTRPVR